MSETDARGFGPHTHAESRSAIVRWRTRSATDFVCLSWRTIC